MNAHRLAAMAVLLLAGCARHQPAPRAAASPMVPPSAMYNSIVKAVPVGTSLSQAQTIMQSQGFSCTIMEGASFAGRPGLDYLLCQRTDAVQPGLVRQWQVALVERNGSVTEVLVTCGTSAQVQARDAAQLPAR